MKRLLMDSDVKYFAELMTEKDNRFVKRPVPEDFTGLRIWLHGTPL